MSNENEDHIAEELRAQMREEVAALSPAKRQEYAKLIAAHEKPPAPDYANMSDAEFNKIRHGM